MAPAKKTTRKTPKFHIVYARDYDQLRLKYGQKAEEDSYDGIVQTRKKQVGKAVRNGYSEIIITGPSISGRVIIRPDAYMRGVGRYIQIEYSQYVGNEHYQFIRVLNKDGTLGQIIRKEAWRKPVKR